MPLINGIAAGSDQNVGLLRMGAQRYRAYLGETLVYGERDLDLPPGAGKILTDAANPIVVSERRQTSFTVWLDRRPLSSVRLNVTLAEHPRDPITLITAARMRFTRGNWDTPQTVTIEANDVPDVTDLYTSLTITGPGDQILNSVTRRIRIRNDDALTPRLELDETSLELGAGGDTDSFRARLTVTPSANVTVAFSELANASTSPTSLRFTPAYSDVWQRVEVVSGADTGMETLTLTPSGGDVDVTAKTVDINVVGKTQVVVSPDSLTLLEGETKELRVRVANAPEDYVVIVRVDERSPLIYAGPQLLTFADARDQVVRVTALDNVLRGSQDGTAQVRFILSGASDNFTKLLPVKVINTNTVPLLEVSPTYLPMDAQATAMVSVRLSSRPFGDVTVDATLPTRAGTLSASELTFTRDNWNTAQGITVTAVDLAAGAPDVLAELTLTGSGGGVTDIAIVSVLVAPTLAFPNSLIVSSDEATLPADNTVQVEVTLNREPYLSFAGGVPVSGTVTVAIVSSDAKVEVSPASMTFDATDWSVPKAVIFSAAKGAGAGAVTVTLTPSGGGSDGVAREVEVTVEAALTPIPPTVEDPDPPPPRLPYPVHKFANRAQAHKIGGPYIRSPYVLTVAPSAPVKIRVRKSTTADLRRIKATSTSNPIVLRGDPVTWTFTKDNFDEGMILETRATDASAVFQFLSWELIEGTLSSSRGTFSFNSEGLEGDIRAVFSTSILNVPIGTTAQVGIRLSKMPTGPISVTVLEDELRLRTPSARFRFTPQNWNIDQQVSITAIDDGSGVIPRSNYTLFAFVSGVGASSITTTLTVGSGTPPPTETETTTPLQLAVAYEDSRVRNDVTFRDTWISWEAPPGEANIQFIMVLNGPFGPVGGLGSPERPTRHTAVAQELHAGQQHTATVTTVGAVDGPAFEYTETITFTPPL